MYFGQSRRQEKTQGGRICQTLGGVKLGVLIPALALLICLPLSVSARGGADQKQKDKQQDPQQVSITSPIPPPDPQAIDILVSQMLGAWQVGDVDLMHKAYADDVTMVSGQWEPPIFGWTNYVRAYQAQRARTQGDRLERTNTYTKVTGNMAWCTYQWQYTGQVDGVPAAAFGHTTLVLEKRNGAWLIVLNHTSVIPVSQPASSSAAPGIPQPANQNQRQGPGN